MTNNPPAIIGVRIAWNINHRNGILITPSIVYLRGVPLPALPLRVSQILPFENQIPVEAASQIGGSPDVLERIHADYVYNRANYASRILEQTVN